jgi:hypothetical protein
MYDIYGEFFGECRFLMRNINLRAKMNINLFLAEKGKKMLEN